MKATPRAGARKKNTPVPNFRKGRGILLVRPSGKVPAWWPEQQWVTVKYDTRNDDTFGWAAGIDWSEAIPERFIADARRDWGRKYGRRGWLFVTIEVTSVGKR